MFKQKTTYTMTCDVCGKIHEKEDRAAVFNHRRNKNEILKKYEFKVASSVNLVSRNNLIEGNLDICQECFIKFLECFIEDLKIGKTKEYKESDDDEY